MKRKTYSEELNFLTLTVVDWIDVFTRREYKDFLIENMDYCRREKNFKIYAYVIMTNHVHMIAKSDNFLLSDILRDFKSYTSKELFKMIAANPHESKKNWMLTAFKNAGHENSLNRSHQFWQNGNHPIALFSNKVIQQKVEYIHNNPVVAGFVDEPAKYFYSSANPLNPLNVNY